jgi:malonyl-CoA/methylmalonyl-CoA synthetase
MMMQSPLWLGQHSARNLPDLFQEKLISPDRLWATCDDGRRFTYAQFWALAGRMAARLSAAGAKPGDRIAVQVDKSMEALALFWACARGGFMFVPLNTAYTATEISYFLTDAEAYAFIVAPARLPDALPVAMAAGCQIVLTLDDAGQGSVLESPAADFTDVTNAWDDIAAILYTSGTTGRSKGAMLSHGNLASNALALIDQWRFTQDDVLLHALPVYHTHGLFVGMNTVLLSGGQLIFHRTFNADDVLRDLARATSFMGVPTFYTRLLQHQGLTPASTQHMRLFVSGSAPLLAETHREFETRSGHAILERYGMTETSMITSNPCDGARRAGTVGFALPHVEVNVTDPATGTARPQGHDGMIEVRGPNVFQGYWRNPEKTHEDKRDNGFFITGDLGHIDGQGSLVISGRAKDLIITGGFNVYPREIEEVIDALPGVIESAVIGLPHADFGEAVTAVVVVKAALDEADIIRTLRIEFASFKVPKRVLFVDNLPRNAMGKVQKAELRKRFAGLYG